MRPKMIRVAVTEEHIRKAKKAQELAAGKSWRSTGCPVYFALSGVLGIYQVETKSICLREPGTEGEHPHIDLPEAAREWIYAFDHDHKVKPFVFFLAME